MKIIACNLQNIDEEAAINTALNVILFNDADLVLLTGCFNPVELTPVFAEAGFRYQLLSPNVSEKNGMLLANRTAVLNLSGNPPFTQDDIWLETFLPEKALTVLGIYITDSGDIRAREVFWQRLFRYTEVKIDTKTMIIGNFGIKAARPGSIFNFKNYFRDIGFLGWSDAWRSLHPITYEYTWFSNLKKGLQFDFLFLSPSLREFLLNAYHSRIPSDGKRSKPASSALIVELL